MFRGDFLDKELLLFKEKMLLVPFFKVFIALIFGILFSLLIDNVIVSIIAFLSAFLLSLTTIFTQKKLIYTTLIFFGMSMVWLQSSSYNIEQNVFKKSVINIVSIEDNNRYVVDVEKVEDIEISPQRILLIDSKNYLFNPKVGDNYRANLLFESLKSASLRGKSNFLNRGIDIYTYTNRNAFFKKIAGHEKRRNLIYEAKIFFFKIRNNLSDRLNNSQLSDDERGFVKAIVFGDKSGISYGRKQLFEKCGVTHIIAISGLHIGIIFLFINSLFFVFPNSPKIRTAKMLIAIFLLWFYIFITGASPSACRAGLMLSLLQCCISYRCSRYQTYNILFASAVFFLILDYDLLFNVGFQLSYMAVFAIIFLFERITKFLDVKNKFLNIILSIITVTVSVQIITAPLISYHFGVFSTVNIFSNISITTLLPVFLGLSILLVIFPIDVFSYFIHKIFEIYDFALNNIVKLPKSYFEQIYFSSLNLMVYYFFLVLVALYFAYFFEMKPSIKVK